ncbi:uncharacterized protein [Anabrus simplex]|uniref:uncharacterized protein isoform X2 n=1 Tax=Anabrus simplex TaxID=316456 RepID=UPI0035A3944F
MLQYLHSGCSKLGKMSVLNQSGEEQVECPLCMEPLEVDDLNFFPCTCGYQICRFCWHRIRTDENGLCPACRKAYPENPADFKPLTQEEVAKLKAEKRHKDQQRKQKITENRKHLANVRVVQRNLVFVVGLPLRLADSEVLKKHEYFGKFGKIHKVVINQSTSYAGSQGPSASAYVTYHRAEDTLRAIQAVNNIVVDGRAIKASLGTTKYCSHFMKNQTCPKPDCMYLHELGDPEASFTKEEMQQGKHQEYERKLHEQLLNTYNQANKDRKPTPSPPAVALTALSCQNVNPSGSCTSSSTNPSTIQPCSKEAWPSLQPGTVTTATTSSGTDTSNCSLAGSSSNSSSNNSISNNSSGSNTQQTSTKAEGNNSRRQKFDHTSTAKGSSTTFKKRHNSSEENRISHTEISGRTVDSETNESESDLSTSSHISNESVSGRTVPSGGRMLATGHRAATLFEPDNNSFFSTNSFTKVAANTAGSGPEWPMNGLTLTHMPDVLPPVHSSEDWQAAFGFSDSTSADCLQQGNSPGRQVVPEDSPSSVTGYDTTKDSEENETIIFESHNSQQIALQGPIPVQGFISQSSHSTSLESITSNIVQSSPEVFRVNDVEHLNQKISNFTLEDIPPSTDNDCPSSSSVALHPAVCTENSIAVSPTSGHMYPSNHPAAFVPEQPVFMVNQHHFLSSATPSSQPHLVHSGILPTQVEYLRQQGQVQNSQQQQIPLQILNQSILDSTNFSRRIVDESSSFLTSGDCGSVVTSVSNVRNVANLPNGTDVDLVEEEENYPVTDDEKFSNYTSIEQQKSAVDNSSDDYFEFDRDSEIGEQEESEDLSSIKDLNTRLTDDDLGFDPFHETQKALAEMMEKENMMQMLRGQQNHIPHPTHINHLHHQYQQHISHHPGQFNYAVSSSQIPISSGNSSSSSSTSSSSSSNSSKVVSGYSASQHSLLAQQGNHRLQLNLSGCSKLVEGLGHVPPRARLPPPGFTTAPNHMNAFGLGIPRAPSNSGSKILPFMGLSNTTSSSNNGTSSPLPQPLNNVTNNIAHSTPLSSQASVSSSSILFPHTHVHGSTAGQLANTYSLQNGSVINSTSSLLKTGAETFTVKEWSENLRSLLPNLNDNGSERQSPVSVAFSGRNTPSPPPCSQNISFSTQSHPSVQSNSQKTWSSVGPCSDWTALDPAIMSSSRPHNFLASTATVAPVQHPIILHNSNSHLNHQALSSQYLHIQTTTQWLRSLNGENCLLYGANSQNLANSEWSVQNHNSASNSIAPPPPGFTLRMNSTQQTTATVQSKATVPLTQEMTKIGS